MKTLKREFVNRISKELGLQVLDYSDKSYVLMTSYAWEYMKRAPSESPHGLYIFKNKGIKRAINDLISHYSGIIKNPSNWSDSPLAGIANKNYNKEKEKGTLLNKMRKAYTDKESQYNVVSNFFGF